MSLENLQQMSLQLGKLFPQNDEKELYYLWQLTDDRLVNPSAYVTFVGETSGGKSTLINSFFKQNILPTSSRPTTGSIVHINCLENIQNPYISFFKNNEYKQLSKDEFDQYSKTPPNNLLKLYTEIKPLKPSFNGLNLFDTPGINSLFEQHDEVLKQFIPNSDIVVYVVLYRTGFNISDQYLVDYIKNTFVEDTEIPVLLIVNRCPPGTNPKDKRIEEIVSHANDTLLRPVELFIVESLDPEVAQRYPKNDFAWNRIQELINSTERAKAIKLKLRNILKDICKQLISYNENKLLATELSKEEISILNDEIAKMERRREEACKIVSKYMSQLDKNIPKNIAVAMEQIKANVASEIESTNEWTDVEECSSYIRAHVIPFEIRRLLLSMEEYTRNVYTKMDEELSEMANLSIRSFSDRVNYAQNPQLAGLMNNIARRLSMDISKNLVKGLAIAKGGVGGSAAGTGNLVKMALSRTGKLFNKTFSRETYNAIGRTFTKKMMQRLNIAFMVVADVATFVYDAITWQSKLIDSANSSLDKWADDTISEFKNNTINDYTNANMESVTNIYEGFINEIKRNIDNIQNKIDQKEIDITKATLKHLEDILEKLEGE